MRIKRLRWAGALLAFALVATACGGDDTPDDGGTETQEPGGADTESPTDDGGDQAADDVLVVGTTEKPSSIDPARVYEKFASDILFNTTDTLVALEPGSGDAVPGVAESWDISDDGLTYTFTLREGVTFQDGSDLTSEDVKWSLERSLNINHPDGASFLIGAIESIEAPDDRTVVITIGSPNVTFLSRLAYSVGAILPSDSDTYSAPESALEEPSAEEANEFIQNSTILGSGPYQLTDYDPDQGATLQAWDGYWGDAPLIPTVRIQFFENSAQMKSALENGEIDLNVQDFTPTEFTSLEQSEGITVETGDGGRIRYIVIDVTQAPFDDPNVRRAMSANIDRQRIIDEVFEGNGQPIYSMIPPGYPASKDYMSDIDASLDEPVDITLWYPLNKYGDTEDAVAETIARSLEESGQFTVETQSADWASEYVNNLNNGVYAAYLLGWYPDYIDPDDYIEPFYHSERTFLGFYQSDQMDSLIDQEQQESDLEARLPIFDEIQQLAAQDMPFIPLYEESTTAAYVEGLTGVENSIDIAIQARWFLIGRG
ncbi:MAG: ABC transporter substrate-binding protein [Nitriliruptorales bacterium]|nr:ABC transporter substrate-binding protein [Nitriliruptorales bacterium]